MSRGMIADLNFLKVILAAKWSRGYGRGQEQRMGGPIGYCDSPGGLDQGMVGRGSRAPAAP